MKKGLYRFVLPHLGECARTHLRAGDGAPFLERSVYEALQFQPAFDALPTHDEYRIGHPVSNSSARRYEQFWFERGDGSGDTDVRRAG